MTSNEKIEALSAAMLRSDEQFDGLLGLVQAAVALEKTGMGFPGVGPIKITEELPPTAELDDQLLAVAGFVLWLRSDNAPVVDADEIVHRMPGEIAALVAEAGFVT